jgi:hypothetical protein
MGTTQEARAIDHISASIDERREHFCEILGVVFEISVLDEDVWSARYCESGPKSRTLSGICVVIENLHFGVLILLEKFSRTIGRCVIDHDDFDVEATVEDALDDIRYSSVLVVYRDND